MDDKGRRPLRRWPCCVEYLSVKPNQCAPSYAEGVQCRLELGQPVRVAD